MRKPTTTLLIMAVAFLFGGAWWFLREEDATHEKEHPEDNATHQGDSGRSRNNSRMQSLQVSLLDNKIGRLEDRFKDFEARVNNGPEVEDEEPDDVAGLEQDSTMQDPQKRSEAFLNKLNDNFERQGYDSVWAPFAAETVQKELSALSESAGFEVKKIECRTNGCKATVEFDNYQQARMNAHQLVLQPFSLECASGITVPEPGNESENQPYEATLFLENCARQDNLS